MTENDISKMCKALGDENRLRIVRLLTGGELCACKILEKFEITQPTLSHHMKILCDCSLVNTRKDGKWSYYSLNCKTFSEFRAFISELSFKKRNKRHRKLSVIKISKKMQTSK